MTPSSLEDLLSVKSARIAELEMRVEKLEEALHPFAVFRMPTNIGAEFYTYEDRTGVYTLLRVDFARAREAHGLQETT